MTQITTDDITLLAVVLSIISSVTIALVYYLVDREVRSLKKSQKTLDTFEVVREFTQRLKTLEREIVDQRVRSEILELRVSRGTDGSLQDHLPSEKIGFHGKGPEIWSRRQSPSVVSPSLSLDPDSRGLDITANRVAEQNQYLSPILKQSLPRAIRDFETTHTPLEVLKILADVNSAVSSKDIQSKIRRSREHTARLMNTLFREGLVQRQIDQRPFTYTISDRGRETLSGTSSR